MLYVLALDDGVRTLGPAKPATKSYPVLVSYMSQNVFPLKPVWLSCSVIYNSKTVDSTPSVSCSKSSI